MSFFWEQKVSKSRKKSERNRISLKSYETLFGAVYLLGPASHLVGLNKLFEKIVILAIFQRQNGNTEGGGGRLLDTGE